MLVQIKNTQESIKVENVYCVGMNYIPHAKELGSEIPKEPVYFMKSNSCITKNNSSLSIPDDNLIVHYEGELVVVIKYDCGRIDEKLAETVILGYALGIDYTLREVQGIAKSKGLPWFLSKSFYGSAPLSEIILADDIQDINNKEIILKQNGEIRQREKLSNMIFSIPQLISYLSHRVPLKRGDIIFTGTPSGVGRVSIGDSIVCSIDGMGELVSHVAKLILPDFK